MKKLLKILTVVFTLCVCVFDTRAINVVSPTDYFYINDYANIIDQDVENHITNYNDVLYAETGSQFVVVTVNNLSGNSIYDYAYELFNEWGIGTINNGVLLILSVEDDDYYCMTGAKITSFISDGQLDNLLFDYLEDDFADKNYSDGVLSFFNVVYGKLENYYGFTYNGASNQSTNNQGNNNSNTNTQTNTTPKQSVTDTFVGVIVFLVFAMLVVLIVFRPRRDYVVIDGRRRHRWGMYPIMFGRRRPRRPRYGGYGPGPGPQSYGPGPVKTSKQPNRQPVSGGGGSTRGGGAGRSTSIFGGGGSSSSGAGRSSSSGRSRSTASSRPSGMSRGGGGGRSRGGGAGRK